MEEKTSMNQGTKALINKASAILMAVIVLFCLFGCGKAYSSKYRAVAFVHSNEERSAYMSFSSLEGRMVFKLKPI